MEKQSANGARPKYKEAVDKEHEDMMFSCLPTDFEQHPRYPKFMHPAMRYQSFERWPNKNNLSIMDLASSGFFWQGEDECIRCFHCGKGFRDWAPLHAPDVEHAFYSPKCLYLEKVRGKAFMDDMKQFYVQGGISSRSSTRKSQQGSSDELAEGFNYEIRCIETKKELRDEHISLSRKTICKLCTQRYVSCITECCRVIFYCYECATGLTNCPNCYNLITVTEIHLHNENWKIK